MQVTPQGHGMSEEGTSDHVGYHCGAETKSHAVVLIGEMWMLPAAELAALLLERAEPDDEESEACLWLGRT